MRVNSIILVPMLCAACFGQPQSSGGTEEIDLPIPIASPRTVEPGTVAALTPDQKVRRAIRGTISLRSLAGRALLSGYNHWRDDPEEWSGNLDGYGQRFGSRMGRLAVRQGVQLSADLAFGIEPRYDRCNCTGMSRVGHAWRRVVVSRRDHGGEIIGISNFAGAYVPPMITDHWLPESRNTWGHKWQNGTTFLLMRGATNTLREFWPDIARKLRLQRFKAD